MVPSVIVIMLVLIPAIMATIGVVREVETGSIANFRSTPISKFEFLLGKQVPYVVVGMLTFIIMVLMAFVVFHVPVKGSFGALALGALLYVFSTCGFGQLVSTFTRTQVAAVFATTVIAIIPTVNFSGLLVPVSSLTGQGRLIGLMFPAAWFQPISVGTFTKGLAFLISGSMRSSLRSSRPATSLPLIYSCGSRRAEMSATSQAADAPEQATPHAVTKPKRPGSNRFAKLRLHLANIYRLMIKELRSFRSDPIMLLLVAYSFTFAIYAAATGASTEATNLSVGIVDEDHSDLSRRIADGLTPPTFKPAVQIAATETDAAMNSQRFLFVIEIPPKFQADILAGRQPTVQIDVDATASAQAFNGMTYIQNVINNYVTQFISGREGLPGAPVKVVTQAKFNPNFKSSWFTSVMQIISNLTMITVILTGAALIREREQGTVEHLLVMPVVPAEIMLSKILANGIVIVLATALSLTLVVAVVAASADRRIASAFPGRRLLLCVHGRSAWHCSRHRRFHDGPVRSAVNPGVAGDDAAFRKHDAAGKHAGLAAVPHEGDQPDAALRDFRPGCALSRRGFLHCLAGDFSDDRHRRCLFRLCALSFPPRHFQRLSP